jgi:outer membrane protein TolC
MVKTSLLVTTSLIIFGMGSAHAKSAIVLSQKDVAEMVLKQSDKSKEINLKYQQTQLGLAQSRSAYDWRLAAESGLESDKTESFSLQNAKFDRLKTSILLNKPLSTGTQLGLELYRTSQKSDYGAFSSVPSGSLTYDLLGFSIEQALLYNFLGEADRAALSSAETSFKASNEIRANELQELVLEGIRAFWNTYVAQENFKEATASRDRYSRLVDSVKRKTSYGYANPGELAQAQAEFESRFQAVKNTSAEYLRSLENLITLLNLPSDSEIEFKVSKSSIPEIPELQPIAITELRSIKSQKLKVQAAQEAFEASRSKSHPTLNAVGKVYSSGLENSAESSYAEMVGGTKSKYYVGLKLSYNFGSDIQNEDMLNKKLTFDTENIRLRKAELETNDRLRQAERKVQTSYAVAVSTQKAVELREKAMQQLNAAFAQGRTDISVLIDSMNRFFNSQIQYTRAIGDYQIALNEWSSLRDELIPREKEN